jgi:hypothetical protein
LPTSISNYYRITVLIVIALLLGFSLSSALNDYQTSVAASQGVSGDDMVTAWDKRLRKVRQILPKYGVVGYLADWDIPDYSYGSSDQEVEFLLAQYTVAPVVLERGAHHQLILGNFSDNGDPQKIENVQKQLDVKLIQPFSNEIFLFEGKTE